ncbi:MAG TPA: ferritin family protein [Anaerohalosphaeraceae bacterium]|nr:ferritin family protein [Anaerohalosphaeraceae bacterium]HOL89801.1 ferritin family protein [Anaerohalosphaeraceae bacterium]HPP57344.1 ferritin family protein [Anaerohalosphaeraceae bacterium]
MSIFEFAIQMEKEGAAFYRELAEKSPNPSVQSVLRMLADEEDKHAQAVRAIASEEPADCEMAETDVLAHARNIFRRAKEFGETFVTETDQIQLYRQALEIEEKSRAFYLDRADQVPHPRQRYLFVRLADEEARHAVLLENLIELVSRPKQWLENAEFFHQEEY